MKNLYVANLPHSTTEAELRNLFEAHGAVQKIALVTDRNTGRSRGFGFVEMSNGSEAGKAIATLNGTDLGCRTLTINEAKPKSERSPWRKPSFWWWRRAWARRLSRPSAAAARTTLIAFSNTQSWFGQAGSCLSAMD